MGSPRTTYEDDHRGARRPDLGGILRRHQLWKAASSRAGPSVTAFLAASSGRCIATHDGVLWIGTYDGGLGRKGWPVQSIHDARRTLRRRRVPDPGGSPRLSLDERQSRHSACQQARTERRGRRRGDRVTSLSLGKGDGLLNAECNGGTWPAATTGAGWHLWFPTQDGVAVIDPETFASSSHPVPPRIEAVLIDRVPVPAGPPRPDRARPGGARDSYNTPD